MEEPSVSLAAVNALDEKAKRIFNRSLAEPATALPLAFSSEEKQVPTDDLSLLVYVALSDCKASKDLYLQFIKSLEKKAMLEARLKALNERIRALVSDVKAREAVFEDAKFDEHLNSLQDEDSQECEKESTDLNQNLSGKREAFKDSFILLSQLEGNRLQLHRELVKVLLELAQELPPVAAKPSIQDKIAKRVEELVHVDNVATSDGELLAPDTAATFS